MVALRHVCWQLSAFAPDEREVSFANEPLDLGFDPCMSGWQQLSRRRGRAWQTSCRQTRLRRAAASPARTDGEQEIKTLKHQVGTLTRAKEALAAELEAARAELAAVQATVQSDVSVLSPVERP
jgi:hypothetical protein